MTDYKAIKLIQCGTEYCFKGGVDTSFCIDYMAVGGGGAGGNGTYGGSGGGGGNVKTGTQLKVDGELSIIVGEGGQPCNDCNGGYGKPGGDSKIMYGDKIYVVAEGGRPGLGMGGASTNVYCAGGYSGNGNPGGIAHCYYGNAGGGGFSGCGGNNRGYSGSGHGGTGYNGMAGGGGGGGRCGFGCGCDGGGNGGADATNFGGGGGGSGQNCTCGGRAGYQGVVDICYPIGCDYGILSSSGGDCCFTCDGYCVHRFLNNGTFSAGKTVGCKVKYLVVGGGGAGYQHGGGGGDVCIGTAQLWENGLDITVGCGGEYICSSCVNNGTLSCICELGVVALPGLAPVCNHNGTSGSQYLGGGTAAYSCAYGGGAGATSAGENSGENNYDGGNGGTGLCGYGGGGGGGTKATSYGLGCDGGGDGAICCSGRCGCAATNFGGGGGGGYFGGGNGCQGVVDICYDCGGGDGITCATGGDCCYVCDGYCVHRFTSNGTFTIVS